MTPAQIRDYLQYYRDLGIETIYRAAPPVLPAAVVMAQETAQPASPRLPEIVPRGDTLAKIREDIGDCKRCRLCEGRNKIVFGSGNETSPLVFVGEGPGADEDEQGLPFVGRAGQLLNNMITAMGTSRQQVYIANIVKCRPPKNRAPEPVEANTCLPFLLRQIDIVQPKI